MKTKLSKYRLQSCFPKWAPCLGSTSKQHARCVYCVPVCCLADIHVGILAQASLQSCHCSGGINTGQWDRDICLFVAGLKVSHYPFR